MLESDYFLHFVKAAILRRQYKQTNALQTLKKVICIFKLSVYILQKSDTFVQHFIKNLIILNCRKNTESIHKLFPLSEILV